MATVSQAGSGVSREQDQLINNITNYAVRRILPNVTWPDRSSDLVHLALRLATVQIGTVVRNISPIFFSKLFLTMTNQSRVQPAPASTALVAASATPIYMAMPFMVLVPGFQMPSTMVTAPMPAPAPPADTKVKKDADPPAAARTPPGAGLPAPLVALLRGEDGPFLANEVFSIAPSQPLAAVPEDTPAPEWYAITRGRFVGVVDQYALSDAAITGVGASARKSYTTQQLALDAFNKALTWGGVSVV
ncbi:hypothetical protein B0H13DRAFT_1916205 [Mycena leptocephala]|nr:hypothetical protein B0H13DRAFT_1916205 [Mycena leptocephala]